MIRIGAFLGNYIVHTGTKEGCLLVSVDGSKAVASKLLNTLGTAFRFKPLLP